MPRYILDWLSFIGFTIFGIGISLQIFKVWQRRTIADISFGEVSLRTFGGLLMYVGLWSTKNWFIIGGATCNILPLVLYWIILMVHRRRIAQ